MTIKPLIPQSTADLIAERLGRLPKRGASHPRRHGEGLVARFSPIKGVTPKGALNQRVWLPAMLDPFSVDETAQHNEYDTLSAGRFSQPAMGGKNARSLRSLSPNAIVVDFDAPWLVMTGQHPQLVRQHIFEVLRHRKPVHLLVTFNPPRHQLEPELDMKCTLRSVGVEVRNGEIETRYLALAISEWRDPVAERRASTPVPSSRKHGVSLPTTHRLRAADTLASLSFEYYGTYRFWRHIRDANGVSKRWGQKTPLVRLPGRWKPGMKVKIPVVK